MKHLLAALLALCACATPALAEPHVVLVTIDGFRWQEVFHGADPALVTTPEDRARYVDVQDRATALTPFLQSFRTDGVLFGDRASGSCAKVENRYWFSYPGYAEMLTGRPNPRIGANAKALNDEVTVLEWLNARAGFENSVRVYAEWDTVPFILNQPRSKLPVYVAPPEAPTHDNYVIAEAGAIAVETPRVAWVGLGDTDNRAHEGNYSAYLAAASAADVFLADLWAKLQADPRTAGNTTLIVTADHGRGGAANGQWRGHGSGRYRFGWLPGLRKEGSDAVFMAARGPDIVSGSAAQYSGENCAVTGQITATLLRSLDIAPGAFSAEARPPLNIFRD